MAMSSTLMRCNCACSNLAASPSISSSNVSFSRSPFLNHSKKFELYPVRRSCIVVHCSSKNSTSVVVDVSTVSSPPSNESQAPAMNSSSFPSPAATPLPTPPANSVALDSSVINSSNPTAESLESIASESFVFDAEEDAVATGGTSFQEALLNSVNILLGVGLLSIPYALKQGGWGALGVLILLGIATNYTGKLLGRIQSRACLLGYKPDKENFRVIKGLESYEDIGEAAFGSAGRQFITFILYTELVGTCGLFFILEGDNFSRLFGGDPKFYMVLSSLFLLPTTWLPDLSALAALGALGAMASSSVLAVLVYTYFFQGFPVGADQVLIDWENIPLTFGLLSFVYAGHAVFPSIQSSMKEPELYPKMLDYTYAIVASVCALVGIIGYQMYGNNVMEEIILNLPQGFLAIGATALIIVNPFSKFALTMEPVARGVESLIVKVSTAANSRNTHSIEKTSRKDSDSKLTTKKKINPVLRIISRTSLGLCALFLATSVPAFASVMALIGSCLTMLVSVIFPCTAFLAISGSNISRSEKFWNYFIIVMGCFCAISGTHSALNSIQSGHSAIL